MAWFKIDDGFWSHPKVLMLPASAGWLWVRAGTYAMQHLTDGAVPLPVLRMLGDTEDAETLVQAGLWDEAPGGGYVFHDWDDYQPTRESVKSVREAAAERQRKHRRNKRDGKYESHGTSQGESRVTGEVTNGESHTAPTRPDPTRPDPPKDESLGEGATAPDSASPPSPFCKRHEATEGTDKPCSACKGKRADRESWEAREAATELAQRLRESRHVHKFMPDGTCLGCDVRREPDE